MRRKIILFSFSADERKLMIHFMVKESLFFTRLQQ